ncbi:MAG: methyltransferase domain-containing protein [Nanoarchaeota archaeon]|nr:methyltransferase domain-containing protein [Nanoarchaeota archaeon]MBU1030069.1 methyltransferase domain-containing protein [Nanoarchaeota archaeon]MBU1850646.1 methyltransferase domain-containing protein [Nanoarchaeota archaeon]
MAKKILIKKDRSVDVNGRKVLVSKFEKHYVDDSKDFSTKYGIIKESDIKKIAGSVIKTKNEEFIILNPDFIDHYKQIKRLAQIITLKDIGAIIANTGLTKDSIVLEAGSGSGALGCFLAMLSKKVISYDIKSEHLEVAKKNVEMLGIKNIEIKKGDIYDFEKIKEKNIDVFVLDVPTPHDGIKTAKKVLKIGGFLVSYSPNINQVQEFVKNLTEEFLYEKTIEVIEREWTVKEKILRPKMKDFGHTAFLTFVRKIQN